MNNIEIEDGNALIGAWMNEPAIPYHEDWDALIGVLTKIITIPSGMENNYYLRTFGMRNNENGKYMVRINTYMLHEADTLIEATWSAVVEFIELYTKD